MKSISIIFLFSILLPFSTLDISVQESNIKWKGSKSNGSYHDGLIFIKDGFVNIENNIIQTGEISIDMNSIICTDIKNVQSNQSLINHLKNDDFFSVETFPYSFLKINHVKHKQDNDYFIKADLTIKDITHPIEFIANIQITPDGAMASGTMIIDRAKYEIKYKSKTWYENLGDRFINDNFDLHFTLLAIPQT
tara:strand:+ start:200 stop:778 length:579 start_codon:yes stop_codon:yes gene_type:complete